MLVLCQKLHICTHYDRENFSGEGPRLETPYGPPVVPQSWGARTARASQLHRRVETAGQRANYHPGWTKQDRNTVLCRAEREEPTRLLLEWDVDGSRTRTVERTTRDCIVLYCGIKHSSLVDNVNKMHADGRGQTDLLSVCRSSSTIHFYRATHAA